MTNPIARAIDQACGVPAGWKPTHIVFECPTCGLRKSCEREECDPVSATLLVYPCGSCGNPDRLAVVYKDGRGHVVKVL